MIIIADISIVVASSINIVNIGIIIAIIPHVVVNIIIIIMSTSTSATTTTATTTTGTAVPASDSNTITDSWRR